MGYFLILNFTKVTSFILSLFLLLNNIIKLELRKELSLANNTLIIQKKL
jgi:hypothetical protein